MVIASGWAWEKLSDLLADEFGDMVILKTKFSPNAYLEYIKNLPSTIHRSRIKESITGYMRIDRKIFLPEKGMNIIALHCVTEKK